MDLSTLEIETDRLRLRAYRTADAEDIFAAVTPALTTYMTWDPADSVEAFLEVGAKWLVAAKAGREVDATIRDRTDGRFLGMCSLHYRGDPAPRVGIWIREDAQGQGFGREAVAALVRFAGARLGEPHVGYDVAEENMASRRIPESLGGEICGAGVIKRPSGPEYRSVVYRVPTS